MMSHRIPRRILAKIPLVITAAKSLSQISGSAQVITATIGQPKLAFDVLLGASRQEAEYTVYNSDPSGQITYWVRFNAEDIAEYIVVDFTRMPKGGLEYEEAGLGSSRFIPPDALFYSVAGHSGGSIQGSHFYVKQYVSDQVAADTGRGGRIIIVDEFKAGPGGLIADKVFVRTYIGLEKPDVNPVFGTGQRPGLGDAEAIWEASYGRVIGAQGGSYLEEPPFPGSWDIQFFNSAAVATGAERIRIVFDPAISTIEGSQLVSEMMKLESPTSSYWLPPILPHEMGMRLHIWSIARGLNQFSIQQIHDSESHGTIEVIRMFTTTR